MRLEGTWSSTEIEDCMKFRYETRGYVKFHTETNEYVKFHWGQEVRDLSWESESRLTDQKILRLL
jgi:hypothetical protein